MKRLPVKNYYLFKILSRKEATLGKGKAPRPKGDGPDSKSFPTCRIGGAGNLAIRCAATSPKPPKEEVKANLQSKM